jgi:transglutaminase-like putative cysteine protease/predicted glutamine amidotransferase
MPNLLAMSFEGELAPSFDLRCLQPGRTPPDGWGIGYYPGGEPSAAVLKEPAPPVGSIRSELIRAWEHLAASLFVIHIRNATWGPPTDANTQPFCRAHGRRDWLFAHSGSLRDRLPGRPHALFEPVGSTDTEAVLCELLGRMAERGWSSIGDADLGIVHGWMAALNDHGTLTSVLADGRDLLVYADRDPVAAPVYLLEVFPPYDELRLSDNDLGVDLASRGASARKGVIVSSAPLEVAGAWTAGWRRLPAGALAIVRQGAILAERGPVGPEPQLPLAPGALGPRRMDRPERAPARRLRIAHRTIYRYSKQVERSMHLLRLRPIHDPLQSLIEFDLRMSVDGHSREYEDVFGNQVRRVVLETPFTELAIEARSTVDVMDCDPLSYRPLRARTTIPLLWMPWHRQVLQPFLLPEELPESQLHELSDYAMTFVERNDYDLIETLLDLNATIHREYKYEQGTTTLMTTPFETYADRRGVCQDFTSLFICLARLLSIPARYVCGYLYTGPKHQNPLMGEASHAWAQVYLPEVGWRGFDPTNGVVTQTQHVRISVGRTWRDATPTSGTIYLGGASETLDVDVRVELA